MEHLPFSVKSQKQKLGWQLMEWFDVYVLLVRLGSIREFAGKLRQPQTIKDCVRWVHLEERSNKWMPNIRFFSKYSTDQGTQNSKISKPAPVFPTLLWILSAPFGSSQTLPTEIHQQANNFIEGTIRTHRKVWPMMFPVPKTYSTKTPPWQKGPQKEISSSSNHFYRIVPL